MSVNWPLYEKLLTNGASLDGRDVAIKEAQSSFLSGIIDDPAYQSDALVNGVTTPLVANRTSTIEAEVKAAPLTDLHIGDLVECLDEVWLVVDLYTDKVGIINAKMWICNSTLAFQNGTPDVNIRHCIVDDGTYTKQTDNDEVRVTESTYEVYISMDEATVRLHVDKRLSFGAIHNQSGELILEAYKTIGVDFKSKNFGKGSHLMKLTVQRDVFDSAADNVELLICNYIAETKPEYVPDTSGYSIINGRDTIRIGRTRTYTVAFYRSDGTATDEISAVWATGAPEGVEISTSGNECKISVPLNSNLVGSEIELVATDPDGAYGTSTKKVQVVTVG